MTLVKIVKSFNNAGNVKSSDIIVEGSFCVKSSPQITAHVGIGEQVDEFFIWVSRYIIAFLRETTFVCFVQTKNEFRVNSDQYVLLVHDMPLLTVLHDSGLLNALQGKSAISNA